MKHRSSPARSAGRPCRAIRRSTDGSVHQAPGRGSRLLLGGLLTTALAAYVLAAPVMSSPAEEATPAAARAPWSAVSSSVEEPAPRRSPVGTSGEERRPATPGSAAVAPPAETPTDGPSEPAPVRVSGGVSAPVASPGACSGGGRTVIDGSSVMSGDVLNSQWQVGAPPADATYDLRGVVSTAFPSTEHPFNTGTRTPGVRTCLVGGELRGTVDPGRSWEWFHDEANAACVKVVAVEWLQIHGTRCDGVEDGFRPQEGEPNSNRTEFRISGTYVSNVADDCLENDYILGGVLHDNLWESCFTGISERPSGDRSWTPPAEESLTLDHMLIGLRSMPHDSDKGTGPNALFKWSTSANKVVIKCSIFFVPGKSVNGTDTMAVPAGTVVDDSACPNNPTTIVWLGGGNYPADTAGIRVVADRGVWDRAVTAWKNAHGVS